MAHSLKVMHKALADRASAVSGLRVLPRPMSTVQPPALFVALSDIATVAMGRGLDALNFDLFIFTGAQVETGYDALCEYADPTGPKSIRAAFWNDRTCGLADFDAFVSGFRILGSEEVDAFRAYGGVFTIAVHTKGY